MLLLLVLLLVLVLPSIKKIFQLLSLMYKITRSVVVDGDTDSMIITYIISISIIISYPISLSISV